MGTLDIEDFGMSTTVSGTLYGDTIKLDRPIGIAAGQKVEVVVRSLPDSAGWGDGLRRCAGMLADEPQLDAALDAIDRDRREATFRDLGE
jgi:hypothetical protein